MKETPRQLKFRTDGNVAIHVPDLAKAKKFYGDVLGFTLTEGQNGRLTYDAGALRLFIVEDTMVMPFIPALEVHDYRSAKHHLEAAGCEIIRQWPGDSALYFRDPFGIVLDMIERR